MTTRPRRTTTLVGPNRIVVGAATAGLVALASAGTALLVLTGTSAVAPTAAPAPPLPSSTPLTRAPGVVVLPADGKPARGTTHRTQPAPAGRVVELRPASAAVEPPAALAFTDVPEPVLPRVVPTPQPPALHRAPPPEVDAGADRPGRHLAKGHAKQAAPKHAKHAKHAKHPKLHGMRLGWSHALHLGDR
jgi:hypothetical protein